MNEPLVSELVYIFGDIDTRIALQKAYPDHAFPRGRVDGKELETLYKPLLYLKNKPTDRGETDAYTAEGKSYIYYYNDTDYSLLMPTHAIDAQSCDECGALVYFVWYRKNYGFTYLGAVTTSCDDGIAYRHDHSRS
jgi:hypothetical protein